MIQQTITAASIFSTLTFGSFNAPYQPTYTTLSSEKISLETRQPDRYINGVNRDNILLTVGYMQGRVNSKSDINWDDLRRPYRSEFKLQPGQVFAFHDDALPQYSKEVVKTTNANFNGTDGFKSDGYLMGNGVCHLASLMNWTATNAGLEVNAPTNHDFASIQGVDRKYGTSIYVNPGSTAANARQNLYIKNNQNVPIVFVLEYDGVDLKASIQKENS